MSTSSTSAPSRSTAVAHVASGPPPADDTVAGTGEAVGSTAAGAVPPGPALVAEAISVGYDGRPVLEHLDLQVAGGSVTVVVGANACGKSTLLRGMARLLPLTAGRVLLDGDDVHRMRQREAAQRIAVLPQDATAPDGIRVAELVARGRHPHQGWFGRHTGDDDEIVAASLAATRTTRLADRRMEELSGGQRQRVWIAMVLAQRTDVVMLDEPTNHLDLSHQLDLLDLLARRNHAHGTTILVVLHDLNLAARYADDLVVMRHGRVIARGHPDDVVTPATVERAFGVRARVIADPVTGAPLVVPKSRPHHRPAPTEAGS